MKISANSCNLSVKVVDKPNLNFRWEHYSKGLYFSLSLSLLCACVIYVIAWSFYFPRLTFYEQWRCGQGRQELCLHSHRSHGSDTVISCPICSSCSLHSSPYPPCLLLCSGLLMSWPHSPDLRTWGAYKMLATACWLFCPACHGFYIFFFILMFIFTTENKRSRGSSSPTPPPCVSACVCVSGLIKLAATSEVQLHRPAIALSVILTSVNTNRFWRTSQVFLPAPLFLFVVIVPKVLQDLV